MQLGHISCAVKTLSCWGGAGTHEHDHARLFAARSSNLFAVQIAKAIIQICNQQQVILFEMLMMSALSAEVPLCFQMCMSDTRELP